MKPHDWIAHGLLADRRRLMHWLAAFVLFLAFLPYGLTHVDGPVTAWVRQLPGEIRALAGMLTDLGKSEWELVPAGLGILAIALIRWRRPLTHILDASLAHNLNLLTFIFACVAGSGLMAQLLKHMFGRARPRHFDSLGPQYFDPLAFKSSFASMPSGHTTTVFAVAAMIALFFPRLRLPAFGLAALLASTRVLVGAHYVTDVLAGALLGTLFVILMRGLFAWQGAVFKKNADGRFVLRGRGTGRRLWRAAWQGRRGPQAA